MTSPWRRRGAAVLGLSLVAVAAVMLARPPAALADGPVNGHVIVPADHVQPGEEFRITGFEIDPGLTLALRLVNPARSVDLGPVTAGAGGTIDTTRVVPADFPVGYAELHAVSDSDGTWTTTVLIGDRAEGPEAVDDAGPDWSLLIPPIALGVGLLVFLGAGFAYLRASARPSRDGS